MTAKEHDLSRGTVCPSTSNSKSKKTGSWRSFKPVLLSDKCRGCGICAQYCPEGCIELHEVAGSKTKVAKVDYDYCKGCLLCMTLCPFKAIEKSTEK
ncbi:MAG: 4Fe-4S binding protein [Candidatus Aenigmarchaeota archaeon]|nr:4Fe-4S binding protein [Candidatus Aenigmarchaeota archaeon]